MKRIYILHTNSNIMKTKADLLKEKEVIFDQLKQFVSEIIGEDVVEELNVASNSIFTKDLEMSSIEIVTFIEKVNNYYGKSVDFSSWLYSMELDTLINLSLGAVVDYILESTENNEH